MSILTISSDRRNFINPDKISDATHYLEVEPDLGEEDSVIRRELTEEEFLSPLAGRDVVIFVHGYNMDFESTATSYGWLNAFIGAMYDQGVVGHMWPGGDHPLEYLCARKRVTKELDNRFAETLRKITQVARNVDIVAHSMGCRLALETLTENSDLRIRLLHLTAPAVDNESIELGEKYASGALRCKKVYVYHSKNDDVLHHAYRIGDKDNALGYKGAEHPDRLPPNVVQVDMSDSVKTHGAYYTSYALAREIYYAKEAAEERAARTA